LATPNYPDGKTD